MAKIDRIKEQIGWLKVIFGIIVAIELSIIGWLVSNYESAKPFLLISSWIALIIGAFGIIFLNKIVFDKINELEDL